MRNLRRALACLRMVVVAVLFPSLLTGGCDESVTAPDAASSSGSGSGAASSATLSATRFIAFGDSMTAGEVTAATQTPGVTPMTVVASASFPAQLQSRLRAQYASQSSAIAVTNAGRSAEGAAAGLPRLADMLANSQTQTQALLLLDGGDDLLAAGDGAVNPASRAMDALAKEGRRRGARVFIGLLPPPIAGRQRSVADATIRTFNAELRTIAAGEGAVIVDLYTALAADVGRFIGADGHHPTEAGYQRIAAEFQARIAAEFERR